MPLLNTPITDPRFYSHLPYFPPTPCSEPYPISGANWKESPLTANAVIDIPCWLGQEIGDFPSVLSRKLLAQLYWMGQSSLRHGNNFLDETVPPGEDSVRVWPKSLPYYARKPCVSIRSSKPGDTCPLFEIQTHTGRTQSTGPQKGICGGPTSKRKERIHISLNSMAPFSIDQFCENSIYIPSHDLLLVPLCALNDTFQVICKESLVLPLAAQPN